MQERQNGEIRMGLRELRECFEEFSYVSDSAGKALKKMVDRLRSQMFVSRGNEIGVIDLYKSYKDFDEFENSLMNMKLEELEYEDIAGRENDKPYYFKETFDKNVMTRNTTVDFCFDTTIQFVAY